MLLAVLLVLLPVAAQTSGLKIVVIAGEDAVNIVQQKTAVAPVIEVRDRNDQPVAGAVVNFAIRSGRATFNGARTLTVTTNAAGRAAATALTPTGTGTVQIAASAAYQGQTAAATIVQTNVATAAQAAGAGAGGAAGGGGGGGIGTGTLGAVGGAAAGGLVAYKTLIDKPNFEPGLCAGAENFTDRVGLAVLSTFVFPAVEPCDDDGDVLTVTRAFGDGAIAQGASAVSHVYSAPGTYTMVLTVTDDKGGATTFQQTVHVNTVTGRWQLGTNTTFDLVQTGGSVSGTYTRNSSPGVFVSGPVTVGLAGDGPVGIGTQNQDMTIQLSWQVPGFPNGSFVGTNNGHFFSPSGSRTFGFLDVFSGTTTGGGIGPPSNLLVR